MTSPSSSWRAIQTPQGTELASLLSLEHQSILDKGDPSVLVDLATTTSHELQLALTAFGRPVRQALASSPYLHPGIQARLATDELTSVRAALAENSTITPSQQVHLTYDWEEDVRYGLALNRSLCSAAQALLAQDRRVTVRTGLARYGALTQEAAELLTKDKVAQVRLALLSNPAVARDSLPVRFIFEHRPALLDFLLPPSAEWRSLASSWEGTIPEFLDALARLT